MVGVPRSQGCKECRKRKKGCDLQRPICGRCARVGVDCSYGTKQWTFVEQTASAEGSQSALVLRGRRTSGPQGAISERQPSIPTGDSERHLRRTGFEIENLVEFWQIFLPQEDPDTVFVGVAYPVQWRQTFAELSFEDEAVGSAFQACALLLKSRVTEDIQFRNAATRLYVDALRKTNNALQDPQTAQGDSVLAACRTLAQFELLRGSPEERLSSQANDWLKHIEGTCRIVQLRGPERHVSSHGKVLFEECRSGAVLAGIITRKPNAFTSLSWQNIPWQHSPRRLKDELFDIMVALPDLLHKNDRLLELIDNVASLRDRYDALVTACDHLSRCLHMADSLQHWEQRTLAACLEEASELYEAEVGPIDLFTVAPNHGFGFHHMTMQYWTALILIWSSTWISYRKVKTALQPDEPPCLPDWIKPPNIPDWMNPTIPASYITKSAAKYFSPDSGYMGAQMSTWPLGIAMHYYASIGMVNSDEMDHLRALIHTPKYGKMAAQWLRSMANLRSDTKTDPGSRVAYEAMASAWFGTDKL